MQREQISIKVSFGPIEGTPDLVTKGILVSNDTNVEVFFDLSNYYLNNDIDTTKIRYGLLRSR